MYIRGCCGKVSRRQLKLEYDTLDTRKNFLAERFVKHWDRLKFLTGF